MRHAALYEIPRWRCNAIADERSPALRHQVEAEEPQRERKLRGVEHGARGHRSLSPAPIALLQLAVGQFAMSVMAAVRAAESVGPPPPVEGFETLIFSSVVFEEVVQAESLVNLYRSVRHDVVPLSGQEMRMQRMHAAGLETACFGTCRPSPTCLWIQFPDGSPQDRVCVVHETPIRSRAGSIPSRIDRPCRGPVLTVIAGCSR